MSANDASILYDDIRQELTGGVPVDTFINDHPQKTPKSKDTEGFKNDTKITKNTQSKNDTVTKIKMKKRSAMTALMTKKELSKIQDVADAELLKILAGTALLQAGTALTCDALGNLEAMDVVEGISSGDLQRQYAEINTSSRELAGLFFEYTWARAVSHGGGVGEFREFAKLCKNPGRLYMLAAWAKFWDIYGANLGAS